MPRPVYALSHAEKQIFEKARTDARFFTSYYLNGWLFDHQIAQPWQLEMHHCPQTEHTVIGGFGSGKTIPYGVSYLVRCATTPFYKFMNVSQVAYQSRQMYDGLKQVLANTKLFAQHGMVWKVIEKPYPKIVLRNDYIGESSMEFMSADENGEKILSWEGDSVHIDEAGLIPDLEDLCRNLGTRLRGTVQVPDLWDPAKTLVREREARLTMTSNSWENPFMWWRLEMAKLDPDEYWGRVLSTYDNKNVTERQLKKFEGRITTEADRQRWLKGARPKGIGDQYSAEMIDGCIDVGLLPLVEKAVEDKIDGFAIETAPKVGIYRWVMPPDAGRVYAVVGDPGQGNPPYRNAPCIMVWDITAFPKGPAVLRAFWWGFGQGSYDPFVSKMYEWMTDYQATDGAFDSTGTQKMMDELVFERDGMPIIGMNMAGMKHHFNTALKLFMDRRLIQIPDIQGIRAQLGNYAVPDTKIAQDIVACMQMTAGYLRKYYYVAVGGQDEVPDDDRPMDPETQRFHRAVGIRYARSAAR